MDKFILKFNTNEHSNTLLSGKTKNVSFKFMWLYLWEFLLKLYVSLFKSIYLYMHNEYFLLSI